MKPPADPATLEVLAGAVERVTFHNAGSEFCVLQIKARGHHDLVPARLSVLNPCYRPPNLLG